MSIRVSLLMAVAAGIGGIAAAQAMPRAAHLTLDESLLTSGSSGCGLGVHRGPFDHCIPFYPVYPIYPVYSDSHPKVYSYRSPARTRNDGQPSQRANTH